MLTATVCAASLVAGFAVAEATGVRASGAVVLLLALLWCARAWCHRGGLDRLLALSGAYVAAFVGSHLLARGLDAWPAVLVSAALLGTTVAVVDRSPQDAAGAGRVTPPGP